MDDQAIDAARVAFDEVAKFRNGLWTAVDRRDAMRRAITAWCLAEAAELVPHFNVDVQYWLRRKAAALSPSERE